MKVLGVDARASSVVACLREGHFPVWPPVEIDGRTRGRVTEDGRLDWTEIEYDLARFLGDPELAHAQLAVVATPCAAAFEPLGGAFPSVRTICAGRAALVSATRQLRWGESLGRRLLLVVVSDRWTGAYGYRLAPDGNVEHATAPAMIEGVGSGAWVDEALATLQARLPEALTPDDMADLRRGAEELGLQLTAAAGDDAEVAWHGAHNRRLASTARFTRRISGRWASVRRLSEALQVAAGQIVAELQGLDRVLLAGPGVDWPFPARIAAGFAPATTLDAAHLAVARGAAWWPEFGERLFVSSSQGTPGAAPLAAPAGSTGGPGVDLAHLARVADRMRGDP